MATPKPSWAIPSPDSLHRLLPVYIPNSANDNPSALILKVGDL